MKKPTKAVCDGWDRLADAIGGTTFWLTLAENAMNERHMDRTLDRLDRLSRSAAHLAETATEYARALRVQERKAKGGGK